MLTTSQSLEFFILIPICIGLFLIQIPQLFISPSPDSSTSSTTSHHLDKGKTSSHIFSITRCWSLFLFFLFFLLTCFESRMTPLISLIILLLIISGYFIEHHPTSQLVFHLIASCSWIGCFDLYFRTSFDQQTHFYHFFDMKWLVAVYLTTSIVIRAQLGNQWQLQSIPHMFVGIPLLCFYYWGLEMPICGMMETAFFSCELMNSPPISFIETEFEHSYRLFGVGAIVLLHLIYGQIMISFLPEPSREREARELEEEEGQQQSHHRQQQDLPRDDGLLVQLPYGRKRRSISGVESQREPGHAPDRSVSTVSISASLSRASTVSDSISLQTQEDPTRHRLPQQGSDERSPSVLSEHPSSPSSSSYSCDLSNYTSDILLRLPTILESATSASFWSSLVSFQPNLLHSQHQFPSHSLKTERLSKDSHTPITASTSATQKSRCSNSLHNQRSSQRILRNPMASANSVISPDNFAVAMGGGTYEKARSGSGSSVDSVSSTLDFCPRPSCSRTVLTSSTPSVPSPLPSAFAPVAVTTSSSSSSSSTLNCSASELTSASPSGSISEEEAYEIVQRRLHCCKTKRAH
jgi:hypothetical protein